MGRGPAAALILAMVALPIGSCQHQSARDAGGEPLRSSVRVGLTFTRIGTGRGIRFEGQGHFARYAAVDADRVPTILGLPDRDSIPLDGCRVVDSASELDRALSAANSPIDVKLLDAGRLIAKGPIDATALVPRHYPELTPYIAGVMYRAEESPSLDLDYGANYEVAGEGGEDIGPFTAQVHAPRAFPTLDVPVYQRGGDLEVRWQNAGEASDPMLLTVAWTSKAGALEVRCRVRDDGSFTVPRELLAAMPAPSQLTTAEVSAVRARRSPLAAPGASTGELEVALREVLPLPVSSWPAPGSGLPSPATAAPPSAPPTEVER